jgi:hypothetical protein
VIRDNLLGGVLPVLDPGDERGQHIERSCGGTTAQWYIPGIM